MKNLNILQESFNLIFEILKTAINVECMIIRYKSQKSDFFKIVKNEGCPEEFLNKMKCKEIYFYNNEFRINNNANTEDCPCILILNKVKEFLENEEVKEVFSFTNFGSFYRNKKLSFDKSSCSIFSSLAFVPIKKPFFENENFNSSSFINSNNFTDKSNENNNYDSNSINNINYKGFFQFCDKKEDIFKKFNINKIEKISTYFSQLLNDIETILTANIFQKFKILIVEDSYEVKIITHKLLTKLGFNTLCSANGKEALEIIKKEKIDLVITDIVMPYINGLDLIKMCYEKYEHYGPKFIIFTTHDEKVSNDFINKYNVFSVLSKPITDLKKLKTTIESCLLS
ncbi:MAG: response regulator [Spirochaetes bacterium]|nr:response regulator [Spirochaetota bacterium]